ncbi:Aminomethyltransferase folate-binding domain-containing protein [Cucurbitaria berberidis CBS 394.84]|uniref:Iron-sulfur cluster assembly factor IBA57 homolog, mitochondrial n=1 Tax=Cucurbitaria berberidis CBS 394.84 TaxID=1168544 RepID=A0A9P4L9B9_9PLEO|nr:Aminomethyltransferase folate-binding domain-containing protein [Cucurbitaria berberidis CBS 394.84]KAF1846996.1 Aminomethyltransferase folate-binding domain-containing protein [Cucurbitaria berberidis CBS 394.84]
MASLSLSTPLRSPLYICHTCRNGLRSLQNARFVTGRALSTASWFNCDLTTQPAPLGTRLKRAIAPSKTNNLSVERFTRPRSYSITTPTSHISKPGIASLPHRRLICLSGPDAAKFLQGLITNNVDPSRHAPFYSAFLDARGRVLWDVFIWAWPELSATAGKGHWACYIEIDEGEVDALKKHLKRHKLRSKITIEDVDSEGQGGVRVWAAWGSTADLLRNDDSVPALSDPRAPDMYRCLAGTDHVRTQGFVPLDAKEYHLQRYQYGIPEGPKEIPRESALPMECNIDLSQGIDFKKGCYVGQELTIRTKHTGVVRKRVLPIQLYDTGASDTLPESGTDIKQLDENGGIKKGRAAGKFIAGIGNVGLALCRLENMTSMKVSAEGGSWKPGIEFGIQTDGGIVKVKPVLHEWFVLRERDLWDKKRTRI